MIERQHIWGKWLLILSFLGVFLTMLFVTLQPVAKAPLLVIFWKPVSLPKLLQQLEGSDVRLVQQISDQRVVLASENHRLEKQDFVKALQNLEPFLLLDGRGGFACEPELKRSSFRKNTIRQELSDAVP